MPPDLFLELARLYWQAGLQIHVHTTGDLGLELVLDTLQTLQDERPRFDHRFTIEHMGISTPDSSIPFLTIMGSPEQQGTSITTEVMLLTPDCLQI